MSWMVVGVADLKAVTQSSSSHEHLNDLAFQFSQVIPVDLLLTYFFFPLNFPLFCWDEELCEQSNDLLLLTLPVDEMVNHTIKCQ